MKQKTMLCPCNFRIDGILCYC